MSRVIVSGIRGLQGETIGNQSEGEKRGKLKKRYINQCLNAGGGGWIRTIEGVSQQIYG
jgi:hypothetical protein